MAYDREKIEELLSELTKRREKVNLELSTCPEGRLIQTMRGKNMNYLQATGSGSTLKRHGITGNTKTIQGLARKKYLEEEQKLLETDILGLTRLLNTYVDPSAEHILSRLPTRYRQLPESMFFPPSEQTIVNDWASEPYEQNTRNLHEKIHITGRGLRVRSKSELIIADKLDQYHIIYRYDSLIYFENHVFSPDFIFMTKNGLMYWEHCGKMSEPGYRSSNEWRLSNYKRMGIVPWKNLIITYDMEDGGLNLGIIESEIRNKLLTADVLRYQ